MSLRACLCGILGGSLDTFLRHLPSAPGRFVSEDRASDRCFDFEGLRELFWLQVLDYHEYGAPSDLKYHFLPRGIWSYGIYLRLAYEMDYITEEEYQGLAAMWLAWVESIDAPHVFVVFKGADETLSPSYLACAEVLYASFMEGYALSDARIITVDTPDDLGLPEEEWYEHVLALIEHELCAFLPN